MGEALKGVAVDDLFGTCVALSSNGRILAVGATEYFAERPGPGYVRVFEYDSINDQWKHGNKLAVAAPGNDDKGLGAGRVRVFAFNSNEWVQYGSIVTGAAEFDEFGHSLDLSADGRILAVGAWGNDDDGFDSGNVRAFQFNNNSNYWDPLGETIPGVAEYDWFGTSVALSSNGTVLAAGAALNNDNGTNSGHVRVFDYNTTANQWIQRGSAIVGAATGDLFGWSVALSADGYQVAAGAVTNGDIATDSGHVRVFQYQESSDGTSTGQWKQVGAALTGMGGEGDNFGRSVAMSADGMVVAGGADESNENSLGAGYVCVYEGVVE